MVGQTVFTSDNVELQYSDSGTFRLVDGISGMTINSSEAPTTELQTWQATVTTVGEKPLETITFSADSTVPWLSCWTTIRSNMLSQTAMSFRVNSAEEDFGDIPSTARVAIDGSGMATFSGTGAPDFTTDEYAPGLCIQTGTGANKKNWIVDYALSSTTVQVRNVPGTAVTATNFKLVVPEVNLGGASGFVAKILDSYALSWGVTGAATSSLSVAPSSRLPEFVVANLGT